LIVAPIILAMKKIIFNFFLVIALAISPKAWADEGFWLPLLIERLNYVDMQKMGCNLTAEEIYSVNNSSLKDAIVLFNYNECSGEMISSEGLMMTAHHCGYDFIQNHSTPEKDYLTNGFWALSKTDELRNDNLAATFLISIKDVTGLLLPKVNDKMTEKERSKIIDSLSNILELEAIKGTTYEANVASFFNGNEYYLFVTQTFKDVRLVGAPPESIGAFGGEEDNWTWPRHNADFSLFRVYMSPDGKPAEYSKKNIPYKPKHFLPVSLKGVKKDDFTLVMGYPNMTDRFVTAYGTQVIINNLYASLVKNREKRLSIMAEDMKSDPAVRIQYSTEFKGTSNFYKYFKGVIEQLKKHDVINKKTEIQNLFIAWYNKDEKRKEKYGSVLSNLETKYQTLAKYTDPLIYIDDGLIRGVKLFSYAITFEELSEKLKTNVSEDTLNKITQSYMYSTKQFFKDFNVQTDKKICLAMLQMLYSNVEKEFLPDFFTIIEKKYKNDISLFVNDIYDKSIFFSKDKIFDFLTQPDYKKLEKDLFYTAALSLNKKHTEVLEAYNNVRKDIEKDNRLFMAGILELYKDKKKYANANNTMRINYGKVTDCPSPTKTFNYYTTFDEMVAKRDTTKDEFKLPKKLLTLYDSKDYGKYAKDGILNLCFTTNNDVVLGNSGSPVINADGELVGVVFDLNYDAIQTEKYYDTNQRAVCVDIRFVLYIIDKYAGASNLIKELTLKE